MGRGSRQVHCIFCSFMVITQSEIFKGKHICQIIKGGREILRHGKILFLEMAGSLTGTSSLCLIAGGTVWIDSASLHANGNSQLQQSDLRNPDGKASGVLIVKTSRITLIIATAME